MDFAGPEALQVSDSPDADTQSRTRAQILAEAGIQLQVQTQGKAAREDIIRELLKVRRPCDLGHGEACEGHPGILCDPSCVILTEGFQGGISYARPTPTNPMPIEPAKDGYYEHLHDCLGYAVLGIFHAAGAPPSVNAVQPRYSRRVLAEMASGNVSSTGLWERFDNSKLRK